MTGEGFHRQLETKKSREEAAMTYETIDVRKTTPTIGAEIFGVDLSRPLTNRQFDEIHQALPDYPEILVIKADETSKRVAGEAWHSDVSCDEEPPMGSILYLHEVPPDGGGDTMFANMYQAYETLSEPLRKMLDGLTAIYDSWKAHSTRKPGEGSDMQFPC